MSDPLLDAYRRTTYRAELSSGTVDVRIGERCPTIDALLREHGRLIAAQITAHNPMSRRLPVRENRRRHAALQRLVADLGCPAWPGMNVADDGGWPDEAAMLVLPASLTMARRIAADFEQRAIVVVRQDEAARLDVLR